ncbi:MAG TPA: hypothetical protein ENJ59_00620 [Thermofilum sp.]|nr:hypothetical protein [Thermofilum sp.]
MAQKRGFLTALKASFMISINPFSYAEEIVYTHEHVFTIIFAVLLAVKIALNTAPLSLVRIKIALGDISQEPILNKTGNTIYLSIVTNITKTYPTRLIERGAADAAILHAVISTVLVFIILSVCFFVADKIFREPRPVPLQALIAYSASPLMLAELIRLVLIILSLSNINKIIMIVPPSSTYPLLFSLTNLVLKQLYPWTLVAPIYTGFFSVWQLIVLTAIYNVAYGESILKSVAIAVFIVVAYAFLTVILSPLIMASLQMKI